MKRNATSILFVMLILVGSFAYSPRSLAQRPAGNSSSLPVDVDKIIRAFTAKETEFRKALNTYVFRRDAVVQSIGMGGQVTGEYHRVSTFTFDNDGNRYEKIGFFPLPTFPNMTPEDLEDLGGVNPFALEASKISLYKFTYVGKERIDELDLYVFDVAPKIEPDPKKSKERLFKGRIWVDDRDLQIVKARGKGVPETKINKFPIVESYREQIDGRYWFPTFAYADDELVFDDGSVLHVKMRVKYSDFVIAHATVRVTDVDPNSPGLEDSTEKKPGVTPTPTPSNPPLVGGLLNEKAVEFPRPAYTPEAKKAGLIGTVIVEILVNEQGYVESAKAIEGPEELRPAAVAAAMKARFMVRFQAGKPSKVSGTLKYDFPPK